MILPKELRVEVKGKYRENFSNQQDLIEHRELIQEFCFECERKHCIRKNTTREK